MNKILIMGLPGSGKTTLAKELAYHFEVPHYNADTLREKSDDWDFSEEGRLRQAYRMSLYDFGIFDFVCPLEKMREVVQPDFVIWMDTISEGRFEDTNKVFEPPSHYDIRITQWIGLDLLHSSLGGFSPGMKGIQLFLSEHLKKLVR
jgi:adenylylsulfate kinase